MKRENVSETESDEDEEKEGWEKTDRARATEILSSAFAQRLAPDTSTLPTTPQPPSHASQMGRGQRNTRRDGENRARGFSLRAALVAGCSGESGDWLAGSYGGSYGSEPTSRGWTGSPLDRRLSRRPFPFAFSPAFLLAVPATRGFPAAPRGVAAGRTRAALDFVSPPDFS